MYIRFQASVPHARGTCPGVFALANGLARDGLLSEADATWWRISNDWGNAAYLDPSTIDPTLFDRELHPGAASWFRVSATHLVDFARGYVSLLERYGVSVDEVHSAEPGLVLYEDDVQVVAVP